MENELKQVIHIENDEKSQNWRWYPQVTQDLGGITVCSMEYDVPQLIKGGVLPANVQVGEVLIKSPYDEKYIRIADYEMTTMQDKVNHVAEIARLLGASKVEHTIKLIEMKSREWKDDGEIDCKYFNATLEMQQSSQSKLEQSINVKSIYSQAKVPTLGDYKRAEKYAEEHNLLYDSGVVDLLQARNPMENNLLSNHTVHLNLSSELNSNMDIAFNLKVLNGVFKLNNNFQMAYKCQKTVVIDLDYEFAMP